MKQHRHFIIHKPAGYLSQLVTNQRKQQKTKLLTAQHDFPQGTMVVGRLDLHSEGLLILTTDGRLSEQIRSGKVEKEYFAELDGLITDEAIKQLEQGVRISINGKAYTTLPCRVKRLYDPKVPPLQNTRVSRHRPTSWISITLTEGKFRQVRKMTAATGFPTLRLIRIRIGKLYLGNLPAGKLVEIDHIAASAITS